MRQTWLCSVIAQLDNPTSLLVGDSSNDGPLCEESEATNLKIWLWNCGCQCSGEVVGSTPGSVGGVEMPNPPLSNATEADIVDANQVGTPRHAAAADSDDASVDVTPPQSAQINDAEY